MAAGTPLSAFLAKVRLGNTVFYGAEWKVTPESTYEDTSSFEDSGYETQVACLSKCMVEVTGAFWDSGANPFDGPPALKDGERIANVKLYTSGTTSPFWSFPLLDIYTTVMTANVKGKIALSFTGKAQGSFVYPTGNL